MLALLDVDEDDPDVGPDEDVGTLLDDDELELADEMDDMDSLIQGGSPLLEKSFSRRKEMVNLIMEALSSWEVIAGGRGNILASS